MFIFAYIVPDTPAGIALKKRKVILMSGLYLILWTW